jgi:hypothetical protein
MEINWQVIRFQILNDIIKQQNKIEMEIKGIIMRGTELREKCVGDRWERIILNELCQIGNLDYGII